MEPVFLNKETDNTGLELEVFQVDKIALSPVYTFFLRQQADLIDSGLALAKTTWNDNDCGAIYVEDRGIVVGAMVYNKSFLYKNHLFIDLVAVRSDYRNRGIYKILHDYLEMTAKKLNCNSIGSMIHKDNVACLSSVESLGKKTMVFYQMIKLI